MTNNNRHYYALFYPDGIESSKKRARPNVIGFKCLITRENWVELINKQAAIQGKKNYAIKASSSEVRKLLYLYKGDSLIFEPIGPDSIFFIPALSNKTYFLTDVNRVE